MKKSALVTLLPAVLILLAGACSPQAVATPTSPANPVAPAKGSLPNPVGTDVGPANLAVAKNDQLGYFLTDYGGMTLYIFTQDTPGTATCYDKCAAAWPPVLTLGTPAAGDGLDVSMVGATLRKDGSQQATYNGWPLYYFAKDTKPGDTTGQGVGGVWFAISPAGNKIAPAAAAAPATAAVTPTTAAATPAGPASVVLTTNAKLGTFLADDKGMSLYVYTQDTPNTTNCYGDCAHYWPPLLTNGKPLAGKGVDPARFGTVTRKDGSTQVTYNGWPLYYYLDDLQPGDATGQGYQGQWYVISPTGEQINK